MEFETVCKEFERMCSCGCDECPIRDAVHFELQTLYSKTSLCFEWILKSPYEAEMLIMMRRKEHPIVRNCDKLHEVFGNGFKMMMRDTLNVFISCNGKEIPMSEWMNQEYKEPEDRENEES